MTLFIQFCQILKDPFIFYTKTWLIHHISSSPGTKVAPTFTMSQNETLPWSTTTSSINKVKKGQQGAALYILNSAEENPRTTLPISHFPKVHCSWSLSLAAIACKPSHHHPKVFLFQISSQSLEGWWCTDPVNDTTCAELYKEDISSSRTAQLLEPCVMNDVWKLAVGQRVQPH